METDGGVPSSRPRTSRASVSSVLPEVDVFIHLLVLLRLLDSDSMEKVHVSWGLCMYCNLQRLTVPTIQYLWAERGWPFLLKGIVWLVIFAGTNFREIGQSSNFRIFRGFNFHNQWIRDPRWLLPLSSVHRCLCLCSNILDYFSDSRQRHTRWHAFVGCCIEIGPGLKRDSFALHVGNKIFTVLIFANSSWLTQNTKINTSRKLATIWYLPAYAL